MAIKRFRIPGLQVPSAADDESRAFFNALKERLELLSGERGDPESRAVTSRELREAGVINTRVQGGRAVIVRQPATGNENEEVEDSEEIDFTSYPLLSLTSTDEKLQVLLQGLTPADRFRVMLRDFFAVFARLDQETATEFPWSFQAETYGFALEGAAPRFRFVELPENSNTESIRPADENVWELEVNDSELSIYLVNDDENTRTQVFRLLRTGTTGAVLEIITDELLHNGSHVLTRADVRTAEVNVGSSPRRSGRFTLTDTRINGTSRLLVILAPGPYTGKGTLADEAEMYCGIGFAAAPGTGIATVYWSAPCRVRGNIRVHYVIG